LIPIGGDNVTMRKDSKFRPTQAHLAAAAFLAGTVSAHAQQPSLGGELEALKRQLDAQQRELESMRRSLAEQEKALRAGKRAIELLERQRSSPPGVPSSPAQQADLRGSGAAQEQSSGAGVRLSRNQQAGLRGGQAAQEQGPPPQGAAQQAQGSQQAQGPQQEEAVAPATVGQAPEPTERKPEVAPVGQTPGVLTPKKVFILEPSLQYSYSTSNRVVIAGFTIIPAITIGVIDVRTVNRSAWTATLTGRYGLTNRLEMEVRVPYVYRNDTTVARPFNNPSASDAVFNADGQGIGDVELTARYQFNDGGMARPYYIGSLRFKSRTGTDPFEVERFSPFAGADQLESQLPTGTGFYGLQPGLTVLLPSDPAVFFGSLFYMYNFSRDVGGEWGTINPGNIVQFNFGMGLALNERSSFSLGYDHSIIGKPEQNGIVPPTALTTQIGQLLLGYSYRYSPKTTVNVSLAVGVTKDAPSVQLTLRVPMRLF
jgi:hypothetical protein